MMVARRFQNISLKIVLTVLCFWLSVIVVYQYLDRSSSDASDLSNLNRTLLNILKGHPEILQALLKDLKDGTTLKEEEERPRKEAEVLRPPKQDEAYGELGKPVNIKDKELKKDELEKKKHLYSLYKFNTYVSDLISVKRSLPDMRDKECERFDKSASAQWSGCSVVMCFHNEAWSVLIRSMHSILDRTPDYLLVEIILVDDSSELTEFCKGRLSVNNFCVAHLGKQLEDYVSQFPKVRLLRTPSRYGLTRARIFGAKAAKGEVLTFLDSHIECSQGWLEPLLDVLHKHPHSSVVPVIETINDDTFEIHATSCDRNSIGGFDWSLTFDWHSIPKRTKEKYKKLCEPIPSPTMAGGLFSIRKDYFEHIGYYDEGLDVWGGENLELSFKLWMCGGSLYLVPCSHIGHIFRKDNPYAKKSAEKFGNFVRKNSIRVAMVWLDDFKKIYFDTTGGKTALEVRERLKCKSFAWYVENVYPELYVPGQGAAHGAFRSALVKTHCLDAMDNKLHQPVGLYACHDMGGHQFWGLTPAGELRNSKGCIDYSGSGNLVLYPCHGGGGNQLWVFVPEKEHMVPCDPVKTDSQWEVQNVNITIAERMQRLL